MEEEKSIPEKTISDLCADIIKLGTELNKALSEVSKLKQELEAYKKSIRTITCMDGEEVFNVYHEFIDLGKKVEPVVYEYLVSQEQEK